jgi:hypothetical protein
MTPLTDREKCLLGATTSRCSEYDADDSGSGRRGSYHSYKPARARKRELGSSVRTAHDRQYTAQNEFPLDDLSR